MVAAGARGRIEVLDVLRGFALCGILLVNIGPITGMGYEMSAEAMRAAREPLIENGLNLFVGGRFMPIFALLFGIGFALFLDSAAERHPRPRLLLVRRLLALAAVGALHGLLYPGEVLLSYAAVGLVVLLPASFLPRRLVLPVGIAGTVAGCVLVNGGLGLVPGLFLLGLGLTRYGVVRVLDRPGPLFAAVFALLAAGSVAAGLWQATELRDSGFSTSSTVAGVLLAGAYVTGLCLLMRTPAARGLTAVFAPLGRMALTNYLSATVVVVAAGWLLDFGSAQRWGALFALAAGLLAGQWVFSTLWLRAFRYGPLEWAWRCVTWWSIVPLRRTAEDRTGGRERTGERAEDVPSTAFKESTP